MEPSSWPAYFPHDNSKEREVYYEIVKNPPEVTFTMVSQNVDIDVSIGNVLDIERFSSKNKLIRTVAYVLKFIRNLHNSIKGNGTFTGELSAEDLHEAENKIIRSIQFDAFGVEISYLHLATTWRNVRPPTLVAQFNLFIDEDRILRAKSRLKHASLSLDSVQPILLPTKHWYSRLVVKEYHEKVFHNRVRKTLNALRGKYWILRGREVVEPFIKCCILCRRLEGLPLNYSSVFRSPFVQGR